MKQRSLLSILTIGFFLALGVETISAQLIPPAQHYVLRFNAMKIATAPSDSVFNLGNEFTLEAWVYLEAARDGLIMSRPHDDFRTDPQLDFGLRFVNGSNELQFVQSTGVPGTETSATAPFVPGLEIWTHVAATLKNDTMRLFINTSEVATTISPGSLGTSSITLSLGDCLESKTFGHI